MNNTTVVEAILHAYPYPIAKCYERLVAARDTMERWNSTRYLLEVTLKYCACVSVARYLQNGDFDDKTNAALTCLNRPSLGHWLNIFIRCAKHNQASGQCFFRETTFNSSGELPAMARAHGVMMGHRDKKPAATVQSLKLIKFLDTWVAYRNRTSGHGAPSADHIEEITPILESAAVEMLIHLSELKEVQLLYLSSISLDRSSYIHALTRLMGTSPVPIPHYVSEVEGALVGHDKQLFLVQEGEEKPMASLHPLAIYSNGEVYLLHHSDLKRSVDYVCHHTGEYYSADRIYDDFRDKLGTFLGSSQDAGGKFEAVDLYKESVRMSWVDGELSPDEQEYLVELRDQLGIADDIAESIESEVKKNMQELADSKRAENRQAPGLVAGAAQVPKKNADGPTRLLFFCYASVDDSFWGGMVARFSSHAYRQDYVLSLVATDPADHHDVSAMSNLVADMDRIIKLHQPDIILMVPFPSETFTQLFEKRFRGFDIPVITVDTEFTEGMRLEGARNERPTAVMLNNRQGGVLAAEALLKTHMEREKPPRYLILPGFDNALHSLERVQGFTDCVKEAYPEAKVRVLPEGRFDRHRARQLFQDFLEDVDLSRYQGIFCCNDGMALGVYEAILREKGKDVLPPEFHIVGFNNTNEFQSVMSIDPYELLLATIDQSLDSYANTIFACVNTLLAGEQAEERILIEPALFSSRS